MGTAPPVASTPAGESYLASLIDLYHDRAHFQGLLRFGGEPGLRLPVGGLQKPVLLAAVDGELHSRDHPIEGELAGRVCLDPLRPAEPAVAQFLIDYGRRPVFVAEDHDGS